MRQITFATATVLSTPLLPRNNMQPVTAKVGKPENLNAQARALRARTAALLASFQATRNRVAQTRLESAELRYACRETRLRSLLVAERIAIRWQPSTFARPEHREIARSIARALNEVGLLAFVFEPSQDTAIQL